MGKLALVLIPLAALSAAIAACGEEEQVPSPSSVPKGSQSPSASSTVAASSTPQSTSAPLPTCGMADVSRTYQYETIPTGEKKEHTDTEAGYSVAYPTEWTICQVAFNAQIPDFLSAVELYDAGGLLRASIYVRSNPAGLTLEEWIKAHDAFFYENPTEEQVIGGARSLVAPLNFDKQPSPLAYLQHGQAVISIKGLATEDFEAVASGFNLR